MRARCTLALAAVLVFGCGSGKYAPVSGKITLNGKPLAGAIVSFQPIAKEGSIEAGIGSAGTTDENGAYSLKVATGENGACVGKHRVMISQHAIDDTEDDARPKGGGPRQVDKIPSRYRDAKTELTFDVPSGGTDKADFDLKAP